MSRGKKILKVWKFTNTGGECFIFASIGTPKNNYIKTLGQCGERDAEEFLRLWSEGFVTHYADIEERLMKPIDAGPPPTGEASTARQVDIERELARSVNLWGRLTAPIKTRLRAAVYQPTEETWNNAYSIIVGSDGWMTLWQAVIAVDPTFPRSGPATDARGRQVERWEKVPSQETLIRALRYATKEEAEPMEPTLGLHTKKERREALGLATDAYRNAVEASQSGDPLSMVSEMGYIRAIGHLAMLEGAEDLASVCRTQTTDLVERFQREFPGLSE